MDVRSGPKGSTRPSIRRVGYVNIGVDFGEAVRACAIPNNWETPMHLLLFTTFCAPQYFGLPTNIFDKQVYASVSTADRTDGRLAWVPNSFIRLIIICNYLVTVTCWLVSTMWSQLTDKQWSVEIYNTSTFTRLMPRKLKEICRSHVDLSYSFWFYYSEFRSLPVFSKRSGVIISKAHD